MHRKLLELAKTIGWVEVSTEEEFANLEYNRRVNEYESVKHLLKIYNTVSDVEFINAFAAIVDVLPRKLKKTIFKLIKNADLSKKNDLIDLVTFAVEEFKAQSTYTKLEEYATLLNVDLGALGYSYCYELTKKETNEILAKIESVLPLELLPQVGKMKKIEYKIGFVKTRNKKIIEQAGV